MTDMKSYEAMVKLNLSGSERVKIEKLADMLAESFKTLENIDVSGFEPLVTVLDMQNVLRDDVASKNISRDELLSNAPEQYGGYFQVPKTLE